MLKKIMMGAALATLLASPVLAQAADPNFASGALDAVYSTSPHEAGGSPTFAYASRHQAQWQQRAAQRSYDFVPGTTGSAYSDEVYLDGHYAGQDPDPNVRLDLRRDHVQ